MKSRVGCADAKRRISSLGTRQRLKTQVSCISTLRLNGAGRQRPLLESLLEVDVRFRFGAVFTETRLSPWAACGPWVICPGLGARRVGRNAAQGGPARGRAAPLRPLFKKAAWVLFWVGRWVVEEDEIGRMEVVMAGVVVARPEWGLFWGERVSARGIAPGEPGGSAGGAGGARSAEEPAGRSPLRRCRSWLRKRLKRRLVRLESGRFAQLIKLMAQNALGHLSPIRGSSVTVF